jgi:hypothetical protein
MANHLPDQNGVQFALHGLLALSSTRTAGDTVIVPPVGESHVPDTTESRCTSPSLPTEPSLRITPDEAHAEYNVNLMTVYRYQIASWVSIVITDSPPLTNQ